MDSNGNKRMNDPLESDLKQWAKSHGVPPQDTGTLHAKVMEAVRVELQQKQGGDSLAEKPRRSGTDSWRGRLIWAGIGALAASILMMALPTRHAAGSGEAAAHAPAEPELAALLESLGSEQEESEAMKVFQEVNKLFSDNTQWIISLDDDLGLGVEPGQHEQHDEQHGQQDGQTYQLQYVLLSQPSGGSWNVLWQGDIISRQAHINDEERNLFLFIQPLEEGLYAVDQRVHLPGPAQLTSEGLHLLQINTPVEIARVNRGGQHLRLYQTLRRAGDAS